MSVAVVEEQPRARADAIDEQVEVSVAVHIGQRGAGREIGRHIQSCRSRDVREVPVAEVFVQGEMPFQRAYKDVAPAVPIDITEGDARAIEPNLVLGGIAAAERVGEIDSG